MKVNADIINDLGPYLKEHLEAEIIAEIAQRKDISASEAMELFFNSKIAEAIDNGTYGIQYLPASYLVEEVLK